MTQNTPNWPQLALVTGASRGLGAGFAEALAAGGTHVIAVARTTGALEELDDRIQAKGGNATLAPMDITDAGAMQHLCKSIYDRWGKLPMWVHTAIHVAPLTPVPHISEKDFAKSLKVNVEGLSRLITYVDPLLRAASPEARAIFLDDKGLKQFHATYTAAKAAQRALTQSYRAESTTPSAPSVHILEAKPCETALRARFFPGEDRTPLAHPRDEAARLLNSVLKPA